MMAGLSKYIMCQIGPRVKSKGVHNWLYSATHGNLSEYIEQLTKGIVSSACVIIEIFIFINGHKLLYTPLDEWQQSH